MTTRHVPAGRCSFCYEPTRARFQDDDGNLVCVPCQRAGVPCVPVVHLVAAPIPSMRERKLGIGLARCERIVDRLLRGARDRRAA